MAIATIRVDEFGDFVLVDGANLGLIAGKDAVSQDVIQAVKKVLGENPFDTSEGVDYFGVAFTSNPDYDQLRDQLEIAALTVPDVTEVVSLDITQEGTSIVFAMVVSSIYGEISLTTSL